jgi:hypothetical protein
VIFWRLQHKQHCNTKVEETDRGFGWLSKSSASKQESLASLERRFSQRPFNTHQEVTNDEDLMPFWHWIGALNRQFSNVSPAAPLTAPISFAVNDNLTCSGSMIRHG